MDAAAESGEWYVAYRTLQSISRGRRPNVSWPVDEAGGAFAADAVDEVDDECFHTSDFEPFSDDDEDGCGGGPYLLVAERAMRARLNRRSSASDIGQLDYSLFEPLRSGAADDGCGQDDGGSGLCSGLLFLLCRKSASSE